jgi:hypothetical protein
MPAWSAKLRNASGGGEERISQAFGAFFLTLWLWIVLALLLVVGGIMGRMPRWVAISAIFLHPLSGVAAFVALDAVSRNVSAAILFVALSPPLIAGYALWARLPQLHEAYPARAVSIAAWVAVAALTVGGMASGL